MISRTSHFLYIIAILILSGFIAYRHYEQKVWLRYAALLHQDITKSEAFLDRRNEWMMNDIGSLVFSRPIPAIKPISFKIDQVNELAKNTRKALNGLLGINENPNKYLLQTDQEQQLLVRTIALFKDSLILILSPDTSLNNHIKDACSINTGLLHLAKSEQKALYLLGLKLRITTLVNKTYNHLQKIALTEASISDRIIPVVTLSKPCIKAGQVFDGFLTGISYKSKLYGKTYFYLNKQELPVENGLGKIMLTSNTFKNALHLSIKRQYSHTNDYEVFEKKFYQELCEN